MSTILVAVEESFLEEIKVEFTIDTVYEYEGIYEPSFIGEEFCGFHGNYMKLSESEITKALSSIEDFELRTKIGLVLKNFPKKNTLVQYCSNR